MLERLKNVDNCLLRQQWENGVVQCSCYVWADVMTWSNDGACTEALSSQI